MKYAGCFYIEYILQKLNENINILKCPFWIELYKRQHTQLDRILLIDFREALSIDMCPILNTQQNLYL